MVPLLVGESVTLTTNWRQQIRQLIEDLGLEFLGAGLSEQVGDLVRSRRHRRPVQPAASAAAATVSTKTAVGT
jgi:hypothetical protein